MIDNREPVTKNPVAWYKLALTRRWLGYLALTLIFALSCVALGMWQFARLEESDHEKARIEANFNAEPVPLTTALPDLDDFNPDQKWSPVAVSGEYLFDEQVLVRNRPYQGSPGFEVLTPLLTADGTVFIINRGWIPTGTNQDAPDIIPKPPSGTVEVIARLKASEPAIPGKSSSPGYVPTIELPLIAESIDFPLYTGAYGLLDSENPPPVDESPAPALRPEVNQTPHLSYALQWILFALMGLFGLGWAIRHELRIRNADQPKEQLRRERLAAKRAAKPTAEDIEDSLIDAQQ